MSTEPEAFAVPEDYPLEQELLAPIPRPVPDTIRQHPERVTRQRRNRISSGIVLALCILGLIFADGPFMQTLGLYFTPFSNWWWLGWIFAAAGLWGLFDFNYPGKADPYRYLRQGIVVVGRVVDLRLEVTQRVNGQDSQFAYDVYLEFLSPDNDEHSVARLRSNHFSADSTNLGCRVGDYLTAVYLPGQPDSLTLYGFTDINPDCNLLERKPRSDLWKTLALILGGAGLMLWGLSWYDPLDEPTPGFWLWTLVAVAGGVWWGWRRHGFHEVARDQETQAALAAGTAIKGETVQAYSRWGWMLGGSMLGFLVAFTVPIWINGLFDFSQPRVQPIQITQTWVTTHQALVKTYEVEYLDPDTGASTRASVSPLALLDATGGEALTYRGALGVRWRRIRLTNEPEPESQTVNQR